MVKAPFAAVWKSRLRQAASAYLTRKRTLRDRARPHARREASARAR